MAFHVFGHINADHGVLIAEHGFSKRLAQLRLAHAGGTEEQEATDRALGILQTHAATADGPGDRFYSLVLTHHTLVEDILHVQQPLPLILRQAGHRDAGPAGHHGGNILRGDIAVLLMILAALVVLGLQLLLIVLLGIPQLGSLFKVLRGDGGFLVLGKGVELLFQALELFRRLILLHPHPAGSLVHQVNGLVREEPVVDVPGGQLHGGLQSFVGDVQLVVLLILLAQALQDLQRGLLTGLAHGDRLETALQSGVLFDILAVLVQGRCADDLDLAAAKGGLEDVGGVYRSLGGACAHNGVQFVDKEDDVTVLPGLLHHLLDALFKLAAVLGASHHAGQIQRQQLLVQQIFRYIACGDLPRQPLRDGGLADARLTDQAGVVLRAAGQDLNHALDLLIAADDRIQLALTGIRRQVAGKFRQRLIVFAVLLNASGGLRIAASALSAGRGAELLHQRGVELPGVHTGRAQDTDGHIVALAEDTGQQMLRADTGVAAAGGVLHGDLQYVLGAGAQALRGIAAGKSGTDALANHLRQQIVGQTCFGQYGVGKALVLPHQAKQQVLCAHVAVTQLARSLLSQLQGFLRSRSEFIFIHRSIPLLFWGVFYLFICALSGFLIVLLGLLSVLVRFLQLMDLVPQLGGALELLFRNGLFLRLLQRIHLAQTGKAALILMTHEVVLFLLLNLLHRCCADGGHGIEEIIKRTLQHPPHQGRRGAEERIIAKETVQHGRPLGEKSLGIAQLLRTGLAEVMLLRSAVDAAAIDEAGFISAAIFTFHNHPSVNLHINRSNFPF